MTAVQLVGILILTAILFIVVDAVARAVRSIDKDLPWWEEDGV